MAEIKNSKDFFEIHPAIRMWMSGVKEELDDSIMLIEHKSNIRAEFVRKNAYGFFFTATLFLKALCLSPDANRVCVHTNSYTEGSVISLCFYREGFGSLVTVKDIEGLNGSFSFDADIWKKAIKSKEKENIEMDFYAIDDVCYLNFIVRDGGDNSTNGQVNEFDGKEISKAVTDAVYG